jgi:hypothetical protein
VDIKYLNRPVPQIIYRATSIDGLNFDTPQPAYDQPITMVDIFVLPMPDGSSRMYIPSDQEGIISAVSNDGIKFSREGGVRSKGGGMPGALLLPDNRVRLFLAGNGTPENGVRIPASPNTIVDNPQPIRLADGSYLMLFSIHDKKYEGQGDPWDFTEIRLATSMDGFLWTVKPKVIGYGGTSCVVEMPDGTLYIYYVNDNPKNVP